MSAPARVFATGVAAWGARHELLRAAADRGSPSGDRALGEAIMRVAGSLRGIPLKLAQLLALDPTWLRPEVAAALAASHYRAPPMLWSIAESTLRRAVGPIDDTFSFVDPEPAAAASLGQVHRATTRDGRDVAIKIQYPRMRESVRSDLVLIRGVLRPLPRSGQLLGALDEVEARLNEELDYRHEAAATCWFNARLAVEGVEVPDALLGLSTETVLTTHWQDGLPLDAWLASAPSRDDVDAAAARLVAIFARGLDTLHRIHADPHPGNILVGPGGSIALIDFGCTRWVDPTAGAAKLALLRGIASGDDSAIWSAYEQLGLFVSRDASGAQATRDAMLRPVEQWMATALTPDVFDFADHRGYCDAGRAAFAPLANARDLTLPPALVFLDRAHFGLLCLLEKMGARVPLRRIMAP